MSLVGIPEAEAARDSSAVSGVSEAPPPSEEPAISHTVGRTVTGESTVDVDSLLAVAQAAYDRLGSLRAGFVQRLEVPLLDRTSEGRGTWYQRGTGFFRMDFDDPPDDVYVADGTFLWLYEPSARPAQVIRSRLGTGAEARTVDILGQILSEARTNYRASYAGREEVDGVRAHVVELAPKGASRYRDVRVWIGVEDRLVRRFRIEEENGSIRTVTLSRLEPEVPLADSLFQFTPPAGVQVFEG